MVTKEIKRYLKDIRIIFPVFEKEEKKYFERLKNDIIKQINNNSSWSYSDCIKTYGEPKDIVFSYYDDIDTDLIVKKIRKKRYIKAIVFFIITSVFVITLLISSLAFIDFLKAREEVPTYQVTELIEIE